MDLATYQNQIYSHFFESFQLKRKEEKEENNLFLNLETLVILSSIKETNVENRNHFITRHCSASLT